MTTEVETKNCSDCGRETQHEIPAEVGRFADFLRRAAVRCDDCQAKVDAAQEAADEAERTEQAGRLLLRRIAASGVPKQLQGKTLDTLDRDDRNGPAIDRARAWVEGECWGLILSGPVGVGKTWICAAAANEMLRRRQVRWFAAPKFMTQARAGFKHEAREEITDVLTRPDIALVLDDLDKVNPTDFTREVLFTAIDERLTNGTPLIVTTNQRYAEIEETFGEPIASRLSTCRHYRIEGDDRRRAKAA